MLLVSSSNSWYRELRLQRERVWACYHHVIDKDFAGSDRPIDQLERALVQSCVAMERLASQGKIPTRIWQRSLILDAYLSTDGREHAPSLPTSSIQLRLGLRHEIRVVDLIRKVVGMSSLVVASDDPVIPNGMLVSGHQNEEIEYLLLSIDAFMDFTSGIEA
jgi:hypothetical protein